MVECAQHANTGHRKPIDCLLIEPQQSSNFNVYNSAESVVILQLETSLLWRLKTQILDMVEANTVATDTEWRLAALLRLEISALNVFSEDIK